jgi:periplasmic protein TonB
MFESVNSPARSGRQQVVTLVASVVAHTAIVAGLLIVPLMYFTDQLPQPPDMLAFVVASAPPPPPPPPPPAPVQQRPRPVKPAAKPTPTPQPAPTPAPVEAPSEITAPPPSLDVPVRELAGIEGGVAGGIAGGVPGGLGVVPAPPPPPPPPPPPARPVRVGGDIAEPRLVHRVNPDYPQIAISARKEGIVILEATVDASGAVSDVRVLRSEPLLDKAAVEAVKQWRYAPLQLNGQPHPFILTVTVSFNL